MHWLNKYTSRSPSASRSQGLWHALERGKSGNSIEVETRERNTLRGAHGCPRAWRPASNQPATTITLPPLLTLPVMVFPLPVTWGVLSAAFFFHLCYLSASHTVNKQNIAATTRRLLSQGCPLPSAARISLRAATTPRIESQCCHLPTSDASFVGAISHTFIPIT